ncbi:MAG: amino acid--tRNA ligase-related protein [Candidatus Paceibacterota bacterium]|jgi:lysyl-tRNA synthetase class 2
MLDDIINERKKKLTDLINAGVNPYPAKAKRSYVISEALENFGSFSRQKKKISIAGKIVGLRDQGGLIFTDLDDGSSKIQAVLKKANLKNFKLLKDNLDVGDFVSVSGTLFITKTKEKSVEAKEASIIVKSLRPLPTQWYGFKDVEERFRKRYLDIFLNKEVKEKLIKRSEIVKELREMLWKEGFVEFETPTLQSIAGGALARPFSTHHNALDTDFYLRIAPELYLKRLLVAGFDKVFELGKSFRNEGIDREHNPEFTILEFYWAYQDWGGLMKFTEKLLKKWFKKKIKRVTFEEAMKKYANFDLRKKNLSDPKIKDEIEEAFKKEVRPKIIEPTFVVKYPKVISPLAKACEDDPNFTERFQLLAEGTELINAYSELNDPVDQRARMEEQEKMFREGDKEVSRLDEDFLEALEYGMPPAAGWGLGVDRLVAIITKSHNVKEIIPFPTLRPVKNDEQ